MAQPSLGRQRSAPTRDIEMGQSRSLLRFTSLPARLLTETVGTDASEANNAPRAMDNSRWPGLDFKLKAVLPGSVYLWGCGERDEGDGASPVSRPEVFAAWVVLLVSSDCLQLVFLGDFVLYARQQIERRVLIRCFSVESRRS